MDTIGGRLKSERLRLGVTQEELAKSGGVARNAQVNYEKGERNPDTSYLAAVAKVGIDVGFVITGIRTEQSTKVFDDRTYVVAEKFQKLEEFDRQCVERILSVLTPV